MSGAYFIYISALYLAQSHLIFYPRKPDFLSYRKFADFSEELRTKDGIKLQGWTIPARKTIIQQPLHLIYFGGNAQEASSMIPLLQELNFGLISIFNYRGYGLSEGSPCESSLYSDALEVYDFINRKYSGSDIIIMGHSLGSAIAGHVAQSRNPNKLILSSPLHSIEKIAKERFYAPKFAIKYRFALSETAQNINTETLILIAKDDSIIPNHHSHETASCLAGISSVKELTNVDHNELLCSIAAIDAINAFIIKPATR